MAVLHSFQDIVVPSLMVFIGITMVQALQQVTQRQDRLEQKVDLLLGQFNLQHPYNASRDEALYMCRELLRQKKKMEAIKLYRQKTGVGLKEAKDEMERLATEISAPP